MAKTSSKSVCSTDSEWERKWQAEQDLEALCRVKAIEKDPKRMEAAKALAKAKLTENKARLAELQGKVDMGEGLNP